MWIVIGAFLLAAVVANVIFWFIVLSYKGKQEHLPPIVIDDDGKEALKAKAMYHGTFDVENYRIFSNGLFAKGAGLIRLTEKYVIFKKKLSRKQVIIPIRYVSKVNNEIHPRQKKPMLNIHWKNGNVELVSHFSIKDSDPEMWVQKISDYTGSL